MYVESWKMTLAWAIFYVPLCFHNSFKRLKKSHFYMIIFEVNCRPCILHACLCSSPRSMNCPNVHRHYDLGDWVSDNEGGKLRCLSWDLSYLDRAERDRSAFWCPVIKCVWKCFVLGHFFLIRILTRVKLKVILMPSSFNISSLNEWGPIRKSTQ